MKKLKILAIGCAVLMSVTLAACGTDKSPAEHVHEWGEWAVTTEPTCVAEGEETRVCELDESHKETRPVSIDPDAHEWGEWVVTTEPSYTEEGEETRVCELDESHKETRPIEKLVYVAERLSVENGDNITATHNVNKTLQLNIKIKYVYDATERAATAEDVTYTSNNHAVATVDKNGEITIVSAGEAEITVESVYNGTTGRKLKKTVKLTVKHAPITEMTLASSQSYSLTRGLADEDQGVTSDATAQIEVKVTYQGGSAAAATSEDVEYTTSDEAVASVNADGLITFNGVGTATIIVKSKYEKQGGGYMEKQIPVTVNDLPENTTGLEVVSFEYGVDDNGKKYLDYTVKNTTDSSIRVMFIDVYYVDATGKILGENDLYCGTADGISRNLVAGEEFETGIVGGIKFPENTVKILIYNRRIK